MVGLGLLALIWGLIRAGSRGWGDTAVLLALALASLVLTATAVHAVRRRAALQENGVALDHVGALLAVQVAAGVPAIGTIFLICGLAGRVHDRSALRSVC